MTEQDFIDAFTLLLSGAGEIKNEKEIVWKKTQNTILTFEFPTLKVNEAIVRNYIKESKLSECKYINGLLYGKHILLYENGNKAAEMEYKNGKKIGTSTSYYLQGNKKDEYSYKNGLKHGKCFEWYENGTIRRELQYENGEQCGTNIERYNNGMIKSITKFDESLINNRYKYLGKIITWINLDYNEQGELINQEQYENGALHGKCLLHGSIIVKNFSECGLSYKNVGDIKLDKYYEANYKNGELLSVVELNSHKEFKP